MHGVFTKRLTVPPEAIDANGHTNNLVYLKWMQDIAIEHSTACGWSMERYAEEGTSWFVRSHFIEYLRPTAAGERLDLVTWIAGMDARTSPRRYLYWRANDAKVISKAETLWVFVDTATGTPRRIPESIKAAFTLVEDEEEVLRHLREESATNR